MYNPFPPLTNGLLQDQLAKGKRYFVRQTYPRGMEPRVIAAFLLRAYFADEKDTADNHMATLGNDCNSFLYDTATPGHLEKLRIAATQPFGYKIFYAAKRGLDWRPPQAYQEKLRRYIRRKHPDWRPQKEGDVVAIGLYEEFGQLYLKFSHSEEEDRIPFDLIESY
jgi:hypothetical protein